MFLSPAADTLSRAGTSILRRLRGRDIQAEPSDDNTVGVDVSAPTSTTPIATPATSTNTPAIPATRQSKRENKGVNR